MDNDILKPIALQFSMYPETTETSFVGTDVPTSGVVVFHMAQFLDFRGKVAWCNFLGQRRSGRVTLSLYRTNDDQITIVDLIGVAVQNLMISRTVYANFIKAKKHA